MNRQGIPRQELGRCVRCNLQIEGSGPKPTDVILDAGKNYKGKGPSAKPGGYTKHVVMRVDRGDGFVGRNFLMRGGLEFGFYTEETDGMLLDKTKFYWNADYGHLSFTTDHNVVKNCDGFGAGDAVVYPGAAPETGAQATSFYPDAPRTNTTIRDCDLRGSHLGYSGSMGNGVRITNNHIYGNATGIASDTLSAAGHPGFPSDSSEIDHNYIYANNFNIYRKNSPVKPLVATPMGTGIIYAGMNDAKVHHNWIFDNWRDGAMLFAVPDALVNGGGAEGDIFPGVSCAGAPQNGLSTSCNNRFYANRMGQVPKGFRFPKEVDQFGASHSPRGASRMPNGNDFWWDELQRQPVELLVRQHGPRRQGRQRDRPRRRGPFAGVGPERASELRERQEQESSVGQGDPAKTRVPRGLLERPRHGYRPARLRLVEHSAQAAQRGREGASGGVLGGGPEVQRLAQGRAARTPDGRAGGRVVLGRCIAPVVVAAVLLAGCGDGGDDPAEPVPRRGAVGGQAQRGLGGAVRRLRRLAPRHPGRAGGHRARAA